MKYPATTFSSRNIPKENGASVYQIWRHLGKDCCSVKGTIYKTSYGKWRVNMQNRQYKMVEDEFKTLSDAKKYAKERLN